jgi:hypothetical protein
MSRSAKFGFNGLTVGTRDLFGRVFLRVGVGLWGDTGMSFEILIGEDSWMEFSSTEPCLDADLRWAVLSLSKFDRSLVAIVVYELSALRIAVRIWT